jgi:hypothetical protein
MALLRIASRSLWPVGRERLIQFEHQLDPAKWHDMKYTGRPFGGTETFLRVSTHIATLANTVALDDDGSICRHCMQTWESCQPRRRIVVDLCTL